MREQVTVIYLVVSPSVRWFVLSTFLAGLILSLPCCQQFTNTSQLDGPIAKLISHNRAQTANISGSACTEL